MAALLIAKSSQADERGVDLVLDRDDRRSPRLDERLATDVNTVLGNLIDNALDAAAGAADPVVAVEVVAGRRRGDGSPCATPGPGVRPRPSASGSSARASAPRTARPATERGIGLALVRMICRKRGGEVTVTNDDGAVFVATLPLDPLAVAR